jgi:hypothetical protein
MLPRFAVVVAVSLLATHAKAQQSSTAADFDFLKTLCDQVKAQLQSQDVQQAELAAGKLLSALVQLRQRTAPSPQQVFSDMQKSAAGLQGVALFAKLPDLAKAAYNAGDLNKAEAFALEALQQAPQYAKLSGEAIYYSNFVLGRAALQRGAPAQAEQYLLAAAQTPGSPVLGSFGPNMLLAKELLEKDRSHQQAVLQFLDLCRTFWKKDRGQLDLWSATVRGGAIPDFRMQTYQ